MHAQFSQTRLLDLLSAFALELLLSYLDLLGLYGGYVTQNKGDKYEHEATRLSFRR